MDNSDYEILVDLKGSIGEPGVLVGEAGNCRFCGLTDPRRFRNEAHTLPEAFGNKWVTSLDECDACNARFGTFDDALVKSMGAVLTVGGTPGKNNKVRQTGRTDGPASIRHSVVDGKRSISMRASGTPFSDHVGFNPTTGEILFRVPAGTERYVPAKAYKALVKMAISLLPPGERPQFRKIIAWLRAPDDSETLPHMIAGLSIAMLGNAPPLLAAALLRRRSDKSDIPYMIFVTTMGSVCLQIVLKADRHDGPWPSLLRTRPNIRWKNILAPPGYEPLEIAYDPPVHLDWSGCLLEPPVIESIVTAVHPPTGHVRMTAIVRGLALAAPQA